MLAHPHMWLLHKLLHVANAPLPTHYCPLTVHSWQGLAGGTLPPRRSP